MTKIVKIAGNMRKVFRVSTIETKYIDNKLVLLLDNEEFVMDKSEEKRINNDIDRAVFEDLLIITYDEKYEDYSTMSIKDFEKTFVK